MRGAGPLDITEVHMGTSWEPCGSGDPCASSMWPKEAKETPLDKGEGRRCMSSLTNEVAESCGTPCDSCSRGLCAIARAGLSQITGAMLISLSRAILERTLQSCNAWPAV